MCSAPKSGTPLGPHLPSLANHDPLLPCLAVQRAFTYRKEPSPASATDSVYMHNASSSVPSDFEVGLSLFHQSPNSVLDPTRILESTPIQSMVPGDPVTCTEYV